MCALLVAILLHEAGHACIAMWVGARVQVFAVADIGYDFEARRFGIQKYSGKRNLSGFVRYVLQDHSRALVDHGLIAAAGPAANILTGLIALGVRPSQGGFIYSGLSIFACLSFGFALLNLIPLSGLDGDKVWAAVKPGLAGTPHMLCRWLSRRLCEGDPDKENQRLWQLTYDWEYAQFGQDPIWDTSADPDRARQATDMAQADPAGAFQIYMELAEAGSAWGMARVARAYEAGLGTGVDIPEARQWYSRATKAGSWLATLGLARVLVKEGHYAHAEAVLQDGVNKAWVPAYFWLAWYRHQQSGSRATYRKIRPLLEYAAEHGHPAAQRFLAIFMARGKFGLGEVRSGIRKAQEFLAKA